MLLFILFLIDNFKFRNRILIDWKNIFLLRNELALFLKILWLEKCDLCYILRPTWWPLFFHQMYFRSLKWFRRIIIGLGMLILLRSLRSKRRRFYSFSITLQSSLLCVKTESFNWSFIRLFLDFLLSTFKPNLFTFHFFNFLKFTQMNL